MILRLFSIVSQACDSCLPEPQGIENTGAIIVRMKRSVFVASATAAALLAPLRSWAAPSAVMRPLTPVDVSLDAITRTTVGLRPFRSEGFVLRAESADGKTYVHAYGHGGAGMTLSWGTALIVRELAVASPHRRAAVVGCGVNGLSAALCLSDAGFAVTVYAREIPPETTSNLSGAQWSPTSVFDADRIDDRFRRLYVRAAELSYARFQTYLGEDYGVRWVENYDCRDDSETGVFRHASTWIEHLYPQVHVFGPGEHPFPTKFATRYLTMFIEPNRYLRALLRDVRERGVRIEHRDFGSRAELAALPEPLVVNCSGLGSRALIGDTALIPVRGQLTVLRPQPSADYLTLSPAGYVFPRSDGVVLGGTFERNNPDLAPNRATELRIVDGHQRFFARMRQAGS